MRRRRAQRLEEWEFRDSKGRFIAPRLGASVSGKVFNHRKHPDGTKLKTSAIARILSGWVATRNNSAYKLGKPSAQYATWMGDRLDTWFLDATFFR